MTRARDALRFQGHYAGPVSRLLAYAADTFLIGVLYTAGIALLRFAVDAATPWTLDVEGAAFAVGAIAWAALYWGSSWVGFARSPGMSLLGLRIVRSDGATSTATTRSCASSRSRSASSRSAPAFCRSSSAARVRRSTTASPTPPSSTTGTPRPPSCASWRRAAASAARSAPATPPNEPDARADA